jgi:hypothetical protein
VFSSFDRLFIFPFINVFLSNKHIFSSFFVMNFVMKWNQKKPCKL